MSRLRAALATDEASFRDAAAWFHAQRRALAGTVRPVPLAALTDWRLAADPLRLVHTSGRFFAVEGYRLGLAGLPGVPPAAFDQPLVNQPEVGILGFLTKVVDGVRGVLVQAKMEPGNIRLVQLAPTVQATHSNFTRVHGGAATPYLEHFAEPGRARVLVDELQPEQGAYFLGKRNRNVVLETDEDVAAHDRFRWLPLAHVRSLLRRPYVVNMDARSVLSCLPVADGGAHPGGRDAVPAAGRFARALVRSADPAAAAAHADRELALWWRDVTGEAAVRRQRRPLDRLDGWVLDEASLRPAAGEAAFAVIGVAVRGGSREVAHWTQPMLARSRTGLLGLLTQERAGTLHALVQARLEAGTGAQLSPTVVCHGDRGVAHPFRAWFDDPAHCRLATSQSEEGGRFWRFDYRYRVAEAPGDAIIDPPARFRWMTLAQLAAFRARGRLSVELRNLLACLDPAA